jgi:peptidyl-prolyl cis-trans isomerase SurA
LKSKRWVLALLALGLLAAPPTSVAQRLDGIAAVVNDEVVLQSDVEEQLYLYLMRAQSQPDSAAIDTLRRQILDQLIDEKLIVAEAEKQGLKVTDQEVGTQVNAAIDDAKKRLGSEEAYAEQLRRENTTEAQLRQKYEREVRRQMLAQRLVQKQVPTQKVNETEAEAFFKAHPEKFPLVPAELRVAVIQIPVEADSATRREARLKALAAKKRIDGGEKFAKVAGEVSEDPASANAGGDMGFIGRGQVDPTFEQACFSLPLNRVSDPIETPFGWHIIEVLDHDSLKTVSGADSIDGTGQRAIEVHARHILLRVRLDEADAERSKKLAESVHARAAKGEDFAELVKQYSRFQGPAAPGGDLGFISMGSVQPQIREGLAGVAVGSVSEVLPNQAGYNIFKVLDRREERPYTLEEIKEDLPQVVSQIRNRERYDAWVQSLRGKSHIEIRTS